MKKDPPTDHEQFKDVEDKYKNILKKILNKKQKSYKKKVKVLKVKKIKTFKNFKEKKVQRN